ncbi:MAG: hypothetical protein V3T90_08090, partial [Anaerolineae bacterium]
MYYVLTDLAKSTPPAGIAISLLSVAGERLAFIISAARQELRTKGPAATAWKPISMWFAQHKLEGSPINAGKVLGKPLCHLVKIRGMTENLLHGH